MCLTSRAPGCPYRTSRPPGRERRRRRLLRRWGRQCCCPASPWGHRRPTSCQRRTLRKQKAPWLVHEPCASSGHRRRRKRRRRKRRWVERCWLKLIILPYFLWIKYLENKPGLTLRSDISFLSKVCSRNWGLTWVIEPWHKRNEQVSLLNVT